MTNALNGIGLGNNQQTDNAQQAAQGQEDNQRFSEAMTSALISHVGFMAQVGPQKMLEQEFKKDIGII